MAWLTWLKEMLFGRPMVATWQPRDYAVPMPVMPAVETAAAFYASRAWRVTRYQALLRSQGRCECCGRRPEHGTFLNVDHIKPRSRYPHLALVVSNLQVLCADCNFGKGAWDQTDWRENHALQKRT